MIKPRDENHIIKGLIQTRDYRAPESILITIFITEFQIIGCMVASMSKISQFWGHK